MKFRTSFFNFQVMRKNLTRFAPLWVLYTVAQVLGLMLIGPDRKACFIAGDLVQLMGPVGVFHAVYALLVAGCLFGDLFDPRLCNGLHAMPVRREGWLITNLVSGLVFALIPAVVAGGVAALILDDYWGFGIVWQGTSLLQFLFFFWLAVFCAMCAGKRLGMFAMYGILNFLSMLIYWVAEEIFVPLLPGVVASDYWFEKFCPVATFAGSTYIDYYVDDILGGICNGFISESFAYLYICTGVGLVLLFLAWLLYRRRNLECAGDFIVFRPAAVIFQLSYTFGLGVLLYSLGDLVGWYKDYGFLVVGLLIGWFTGWMLLERTVKVFTKKVLVGLVAFALLLGGALGLTLLDPLGITTYIPQTENVEFANLYLQSNIYYYEADDGWSGWNITEPEELALVQELHQAILEDTVGTGSESGSTYTLDRLKYRLQGYGTIQEEEYLTVYVRYRQKNGGDVYRSYRIPVGSSAMEKLNRFFNDPRAIFSEGNYQHIKDTVREISIYWAEKDMTVQLITDAQRKAFFAALEADSKAGNIAQHHHFHEGSDYMAGVDINWSASYKVTENGEISGVRGEHIQIYRDCVHTLEFLDSLSKS